MSKDNEAPLTGEETPAPKKEIYGGVRGLAVKVLNRIERTDSYLDKLLEHELKFAEISPQDKALLYEITHGVVRWMGRLDWILSGFYKGQFSKALPIFKNALRVALYQIMFLDKVPEYAAVNEAVDFMKRLQGQKPADITNAVLRNIVRNKHNLRYPDPNENLIGYLAAYQSHPSWLVKRWLQRHGREFTEGMLKANNERPFLTVRGNSLKVDKTEFKRILDSANLKFTQGRFLPDFLHLHNLANVTQWRYFNEGFFNIQDESAGIACIILDVKPGQRVLDLCAAPGGKSAYIADLMHNRGELIAIDKFQSRVDVLKKNFERLGISMAKAIQADALEYTDEPFDRVLVDAPCSGLGTLSKKPDIKWKKELIDIHHLNELQLQLLEKAATMVKEGGNLVYSTCTIEAEENIEIVHKFLAKHNNFKLVNLATELPEELLDPNGCMQTYPHLHQIDGAFAAKMMRIQ